MSNTKRNTFLAILALLIVAFLAFGLPRLIGNREEKRVEEPQILSELGKQVGYEIVKTYPHDADCYTQGLVYEAGTLYESCGLYGQSRLRVVKLESGKSIREIDIPEQYFAEGLVLLDDVLTMLTWQEGTAFFYDPSKLKELGSFNYSTEGWGLTTDGQSLIMSDGSNTLYWLDPKTGLVVKELHVTLDGHPMQNLNELEFVNGESWRMFI